MHWFGSVEIGTAVRGIGRSSFTLAQALFQDGGCTATADVMMVLKDETTRKSAPLPERLSKSPVLPVVTFVCAVRAT